MIAKNFKLLFLILIAFSSISNAQNNKSGNITGSILVVDSNQKLAGVIVRVEGQNISTKSDQNGTFFIKNLPPGKYYLTFMKHGFYSLVIPDVQISAGQTTHLNIKMYPGDEQEFLFLEIGGIKVTAKRDLMPQEPETIYPISSGEIEHLQANSLADVLDMIPGNEKSQNLGLSRKQNINLRNLGDLSSAFGTKIILDDVPLSNNADLQTGVGVNYGSKVQQTAETEYDLREIVAENLEKVEVQAGATSVEYGDNTTGVIIAKTKRTNVPTRLKIKNNPDTKEANLMGSFRLWQTDFVYNFNYGYSERDIRIRGDEFHRFVASLKSTNYFLNKQLQFGQNLRFARKLEEDNDESDPNRTRAYNRDFHITYSHQLNWQFNKKTNIYLRNYLDYKHRNSWRHKLENRDLGYATNLTHAGTIEGIFLDPIYFSNVRTIGDEWAYGLKMKANHRFFINRYLNRILLGLEYQKEWNNGPGKQYDILYPPNGGGNIRPRRFSDIPGISQLSLFIEDRVTGKLLFPFSVNLGLRLDSYNPTSFYIFNVFKGDNIFKAKQGTFLNPRFGIKINVLKGTQIRASFSKSSKSPSLSMLYPENFYLDVNDIGLKTQTLPDGRDTVITIPLISTYVYNRSNPNLKGFQSTKYEFGFDQRIGKAVISVVGFTARTNNIPTSRSIPLIYYRYQWPNWPDKKDKKVIEEVVLASSGNRKAENVKWSKNSGFEFMLRSHRIKPLNMRFWIGASYIFSRSGLNKNTVVYSSTARKLVAGDTLNSGWIVPENMTIIPAYKPFSSWRQKTVINYKIDYIASALGIWLTFKAQQVLWDQYLAIEHPDPHAIGYWQNGKFIPINSETSTKMGLDRSFDELLTSVDKSKPNDKWLFSIVASKSLWKGAEISIFVDNIFNDMAYYKTRYGTYAARNPEMFWGLAFSAKIDHLFH